MPPQNWEVIIDSLKTDPDSWTATAYHLKHKSGVQIWIANGPTFLRSESSAMPIHFGWLGKWKVWKAFQHWQRSKFHQLMARRTTE